MVTSNAFTLDLGELNKIIAKESRKPAELVKSEYETTENDYGSFTNWVQEWEILDPDTGDSAGLEYPLRAKHLIPNGETRARRMRSYVKCVQAFGDLMIVAKNGTPEEFLGQRCWIEEVVETYKRRDGSDGSNTWWKPVKAFYPGEPFESEEEVSGEYLNPPASDPEERVLQLIENKTLRQAMAAIKNDSILSDNEDLIESVDDGSLFEKLQEEGKVEVNQGKYILV